VLERVSIHISTVAVFSLIGVSPRSLILALSQARNRRWHYDTAHFGH
jgi:hypothetical protein